MVGGGLLLTGVAVSSNPVPSRVKARQLTTRRSMWQFAVWVAVWVAVFVVIGVGIVIVAGHGVGIATGVVAGVLVGVVIGVIYGVVIGLNDASPQAIGPRDVIRADGQYGVVIGVGIGLLIGVGDGAGVVVAVWTGVVGGLVGGLGIGAKAWTRYHIAVTIAALPPRSGPLRFSAALEWAYQAGLLRLSGVAYQFRHRQLQDWLRSRQ